MRNYVRKTIAYPAGVSRFTFRLDSQVRQIDRVFIIADQVWQTEGSAPAGETLKLGLQYNGHVIFPPDFDARLLAYSGFLSMEDTAVATPFRTAESDRDSITVDVSLTAGTAGMLIFYLITEI